MELDLAPQPLKTDNQQEIDPIDTASSTAIQLSSLDVREAKPELSSEEKSRSGLVEELASYKPTNETELADVVTEYIHKFGESGGTLAELFTKLPKTVDKKLQDKVQEELAKQQSFIQENEFVELLNPKVFSDVSTDEESKQVQLEMLGKRIYNYTVQYHENTSLLKRITEIDPAYAETFSKALELWNSENLRKKQTRKQQQLQDTQEAITSILGTETESTDSVGKNSSILEMQGASIDRTTTLTTIEGTDTKTGEKRKFPLQNEFFDVLPALLWIETASNLVQGHQHSELMMLVHEVDAMKNGEKSNEDLLVSIQAPMEAVRLLQEGKAHDQFFRLFKGNEEKLLKFFEKMSATEDNMYDFMQNMRRIDLEFLCKNNELPGGIILHKEEVDQYILSKLTNYQKRALGIEESWRT